MLLIVVGPSGVGKSTLCHDLLERFDDLVMSVSYTTRAPRGTEAHGVDYFFVDLPEFKAMVQGGKFAEFAEVHGNAYGTARETIAKAEAEGKAVLFDIDYQGAIQLMDVYPDAVTVMVMPPSREVLEARLRGRGTDSDEVIRKRLAKAKKEMSQFPLFTHVLFNDDLEEAKADLRGIYRAGRARMMDNRARAERLLSGFE